MQQPTLSTCHGPLLLAKFTFQSSSCSCRRYTLNMSDRCCRGYLQINFMSKRKSTYFKLTKTVICSSLWRLMLQRSTSSLSKLTRIWNRCLLSGIPQSHFLKPSAHLDRVCPQYDPCGSHWYAPFPNSVGHQPHLFASQEPEAHVPFTQAFVQWCRLKCERASKVLFQSLAALPSSSSSIHPAPLQISYLPASPRTPARTAKFLPPLSGFHSLSPLPSPFYVP
ncbi:uncharacterized protein LOC131543767 [Onychostoma macrolepis]|uniref:uncharacterized protein LOC131543767 n=1 Tax=Onychostoma macrolepis TaxID=369639 RepID=UPI00272C7B16|nr:uncharacterized protein LOC131543767 [Onychostoma macrolepis]